MSNELPESFKMCIPFHYGIQISYKLISYKLKQLGYKQGAEFNGQSFMYAYTQNEGMLKCKLFSFLNNISDFSFCPLPEISIIQLMDAECKINNEVDEGFKNLSDTLNKAIETLNKLQRKISEKV